MGQNNDNLIKILKENGVVVMPTDTIYGIVGSALNFNAVNRIYEIRKRAPDKPCIILISDIKDLEKFSIKLSEKQKNVINNFSTPTSFILDCPGESLSYLHRGTYTLAFRLPTQRDLQNLLKETGPLVAPSANTEGSPPAININQAREYFGQQVDLYIDGGKIIGKPSKVIKLNTDGFVTVLRN
jgi:L-threonylcarbamoyladenylate synthase